MLILTKKYIDEEALAVMTKNKGGFIETFIAEIDISEEGYEGERTQQVYKYSKHAGINLKC